eukprot:9427175-Karenia_brevis.AAC.1
MGTYVGYPYGRSYGKSTWGKGKGYGKNHGQQYGNRFSQGNPGAGTGRQISDAMNGLGQIASQAKDMSDMVKVGNAIGNVLGMDNANGANQNLSKTSTCQKIAPTQDIPSTWGTAIGSDTM